MTTTEGATALTYGRSLRNLYLVRAAFAVAWVATMLATVADAAEPDPLLTALLVVYPAFDAGAVLWQLRADPDKQRSKAAERVNVGVSAAVAVVLGVTSTATIHGALAVWGVWAIVAGVPQLVAAVRNRRSGGQVAQMLSGGISVLAGASFVVQGLQGTGSMTGAAGYASLGAVFFLVSAVRLTARLRKERA
ncbi:hypothetical protein DNL40_13720 [Xylanimonas oleitrophica]|uniref:Integral membrane protein n=1 Tax=Xylanimonas oleitrophica TaxID=2607479 RepID=A0A2W5WM39_9MICO|nr:DUF308 domain-containing protein [Xylanimonas oleitrophica]PZR52062.1 hypothetical protein DNL40_13720 [Xylanimonas oleitrophica]